MNEKNHKQRAQFSANHLYRFEVRENNHFELLIDGHQFFPRMLEAISEAKSYILQEQYLFESGYAATQFINALIEAVARGVKVHLLLDDFGSRTLTSYDRQRLRNNGVDLQFYNPIRLKRLKRGLFRNHRKLLLIDNEVAFVGGAGISDVFDTTNNNRYGWHEVVLQIQGAIVQDWQDLFFSTWYKKIKVPLSLPVGDTINYIGNYKGRVVCSKGLGKQEISRALIQQVRATKDLIWIATPYFITTWSIRRSLRYAARKGIDVRVLVPGPFNDHPWVGHASRRFYSRLLRSGVRIFEYQPRFTHSKIQLCDDWVSIGSSNLDRWNHRWNLDANQVIYSADIAQHVKLLFEHDFKQSIEIELSAWRRRSRLQRVSEWLAHLIVRLLQLIKK